MISNNPSEKRISCIGNELGLAYKHKALKPSKTHTLKIIKKLNKDKENIAIVGDRILTDIIVGNRCNIHTILVKKLNQHGLPIKINMILLIERLISFFIF